MSGGGEGRVLEERELKEQPGGDPGGDRGVLRRGEADLETHAYAAEPDTD